MRALKRPAGCTAWWSAGGRSARHPCSRSPPPQLLSLRYGCLANGPACRLATFLKILCVLAAPRQLHTTATLAALPAQQPPTCAATPMQLQQPADNNHSLSDDLAYWDGYFWHARMDRELGDALAVVIFPTVAMDPHKAPDQDKPGVMLPCAWVRCRCSCWRPADKRARTTQSLMPPTVLAHVAACGSLLGGVYLHRSLISITPSNTVTAHAPPAEQCI